MLLLCIDFVYCPVNDYHKMPACIDCCWCYHKSPVRVYVCIYACMYIVIYLHVLVMHAHFAIDVVKIVSHEAQAESKRLYRKRRSREFVHKSGIYVFVAIQLHL